MISLVSPVYNEEKGIEEFVARCARTLESLDPDYEMLLVDDCSSDATPSLLKRLQKQYPRLRVIRLPRNTGQHAATFLGLRKARGDLIFLLDSDLQIAPEDMAKLYEEAARDDAWEVIGGARRRRSPGLVRSVSSRLVTWLINLITRNKLPDPASTFLLMKRAVLGKILSHDILAQNLPLLLAYLRLDIRQVPVDYRSAASRNSSYNLSGLVELLLLAFLNFATGRKTILYLMFGGLCLLLAGGGGTGALIIHGVVKQVALQTNLLIFFLSLALAGLLFVFLGLIAYKIEQLNRNLGFRQTLECFQDDDTPT